MTPLKTLHVVCISVVVDAVHREHIIDVFDIGDELSWAQDASLGDATI